ncbi:MAG TPA: CBS domain-containing protein [Actinomycetota bacterium]|nr:CBS domain-containing protein [Actinomycetota bacterium]
MKVDELMSTDLCTVDPEATLAEASTLMGERGVGSAMVIDEGRLVGIVTERDVVRAMSNAHDAPVRPVAEWMTRKPGTATPGTSVKEALQLMVDGGFRHLPICDGDQPVGMVSMRDIARALAG